MKRLLQLVELALIIAIWYMVRYPEGRCRNCGSEWDSQWPTKP